MTVRRWRRLALIPRRLLRIRNVHAINPSLPSLSLCATLHERTNDSLPKMLGFPHPPFHRTPDAHELRQRVAVVFLFVPFALLLGSGETSTLVLRWPVSLTREPLRCNRDGGAPA